MHGIKRDIGEKRAIMVTLDKGACLVGEEISQVFLRLAEVAKAIFEVVIPSGLGIVGRVGEKTARAAAESDEFVKPTFEWMQMVSITLMPLAKNGGPISKIAQVIGDCFRTGYQAHLEVIQTATWAHVTRDVVLLEAELLLVLAGKQAGARWSADGRGDVELGESDARRSETVKLWGPKISTASKPKVSVAGVIREKQDNVRWTGQPWRGCLRFPPGRRNQREEHEVEGKSRAIFHWW